MGWLWGDDKKKKEKESFSDENLRDMKKKARKEQPGDIGSPLNMEAIRRRRKMLEDAAKD